MRKLLIGLLVLIIPFLLIVEILQIKILEKDGDILVYEYEGERCLTFGIPILSPRQTCIDLIDRRKIVFEYQKFAMASLYLNPKPEKILIIGLGGGGLPKALHYTLPNAEIDVVEIDGSVIKIAKKYFDFSENKKLRVLEKDGVDFVRESKNQYDLIILDAFDEEYIPEGMLTEEFVSNVRRILKRDGVVVVNTFGNSKYESVENNLYKKFFGDFYNLDSHNRVIIAGKTLNSDEIRKHSLIFDRVFAEQNVNNNLLLEKFIKSYENKNYNIR